MNVTIAEIPDSRTIKSGIEAIDFLVKNRGFDLGVLKGRKLVPWNIYDDYISLRDRNIPGEIQGYILNRHPAFLYEGIKYGVILEAHIDAEFPAWFGSENRLVVRPSDRAVLGIVLSVDPQNKKIYIVPSALNNSSALDSLKGGTSFMEPNPAHLTDASEPFLHYAEPEARQKHRLSSILFSLTFGLLDLNMLRGRVRAATIHPIGKKGYTESASRFPIYGF